MWMLHEINVSKSISTDMKRKVKHTHTHTHNDNRRIQAYLQAYILTLIIKKFKNSVEQDKVVTIFNIIKHLISYLV